VGADERAAIEGRRHDTITVEDPDLCVDTVEPGLRGGVVILLLEQAGAQIRAVGQVPHRGPGGRSVADPIEERAGSEVEHPIRGPRGDDHT
jgi:hypothetical protein